MNRIIKFRAWDGKKKEMFYPSSVCYKDGVQWACDAHGENRLEYELVNPNAHLMQFTGLLDKNGKEIFEGDIITVPDECIIPVTDEGQGPIEDFNHIVCVEFREGEFGFEIPKDDDGETGWYSLRTWLNDIWDEPFEVIGNICENSDLLK